jgi:transporter family-2 protein
MQNIPSAWLYPIIIVAGALQAWGPPMNGALRNAFVNPWLASLISFVPIVALLGCIFYFLPQPLPTFENISKMPWWAPLGGIIGAFAVIAGLMFVDRVGAGVFASLLITANFVMSLVIDKYGWFGMPVHELNGGRIVGGALMVAGIVLISRF